MSDYREEDVLVVQSSYDDTSQEQQVDGWLIWFREGWRRFYVQWQDVVTVVVLVLLMTAGYGMRSVGRNWDDFTHLHPDERFLTDVASTIHSGRGFQFVNRPWMDRASQETYCQEKYPPLPESETQVMSPAERRRVGVGGYFDARCSDLNPNNTNDAEYVYGEFPLFTVRVLAEVYQSLSREPAEIAESKPFEDRLPTPQWTSYNGIQFVGRTMNSVFDTLVILLVFLIGARLFGRWHGLLASGFYAFAAFPIQQSHFWTTDAFTAFWVVLAIYFAVRVMDQANRYPERFVPLPWIGTALIIWLVDLDGSLTVPLESVFVYLITFAIAGLLTTLAVEQKALPVAIIGTVIASVVFILFALFEITESKLFFSGEMVPLISWEGALAAIVGLWLLLGLWVGGWNRFAAFAGNWVWLAAAFGLWVFDSLAHYAVPDVGPLATYLILFMAVALFVSALRYMEISSSLPSFFVLFGLPVVIFGVGLVFSIDVGVAGWGMVSAFVLAVLIGGATYFGMQDEIGFGLAFGAAVAGRVNVLPVLGVVFLAMIIRLLITSDWRMYRFIRNEYMTRAVGGLLIAGMGAFIAFRFLQPHAFNGPAVYDVLGLNKSWTADISKAQYLTSGEADIPPNHQWANRVIWLFPLQNILIYGLGWLLGIAAWGAFFWSLVRIVRGKHNWTRLAIPAAWILVYFGWLGARWVTTMRYFMPIYGMLTIMAAWGLIELVMVTYRWWQAHPVNSRRLAYGVAIATLVSVVGYTLMYGYGFTSIHRTQLSRVAASRYMQEHIPGDVGLYIDTADGRTRMVNMSIWAIDTNPEVVRLSDGESRILTLTPTDSSRLLSVTLNRLADPQSDAEVERVRLRVWAQDPVEGQLLLGGQLLETELGTTGDHLGYPVTVQFEPAITLLADAVPGQERQYQLEIEMLEGGPISLARDPLNLVDHITVEYESLLDPNQQTTDALRFDVPGVFSQVTYFRPGSVRDYEFTATATGTISQLVIPHISDPLGDPDAETLRVVLRDNQNFEASLLQAWGEAEGDFATRDDGHLLFGPSVTIELDQPFPVEVGQRYTLSIEPEDWIGIAGTAVAWEGQWDDPMPTTVCPTPLHRMYSEDLPSGLCDFDSEAMNLYNGYYIGLQQNMHWDDEPLKRDDTLEVLRQTDYLVIGSNRFYDSFARIPSRWPMSNRYYEALFNGELGFEVVKTFTSYARFGPIEWPDQALPTDSFPPSWRNEFEAEEAFHVYDHPAVFILRKTPDYSPEKAADILDVVLNTPRDIVPNTEPINRIRWGALEASQSPTALQYTESQRQTQAEGGTWSEMFDRDIFYNRSQVMGVVAWWMLMVLVGWCSFPLLHFIFPALSDRGYAFAKLVGWLVIAWVAWFGATLTLPLWSQGGLIALLVAWIVFNGFIAYQRREQLRDFVKRRWRHLLFVEFLTLLLFLFFVGVRLGNPDLWHGSFGGEKPMNFAYFNGVLRSTIFPPIDPWFSGGYINYYYWGYVLVGAPTKVLGIVPSVAYNLIVPTLFALTGMGAFSVAYNLVAWTRERRQEAEGSSEPPRERPGPSASPYLAGMAALMLAVILGNLDTIRVLTNAVARVGDWYGTSAIIDERTQDDIQDFTLQYGRPPNEEEVAALREQNSISKLESAREWFSSFWTGAKRLISGERPLELPPHRWYWAPTRIIAELSDGRGHNAITEMPYFTYLYGDLHAHMMSMPLQLLALLALTAEILGAGRRLRHPLAAGLALFLLGMTVGLLRPTNTWDWPTYLILGVAGLTFAAWVGQGRERGHMPPTPPFLRLRRYLDARYVVELWPLLLVIPLGIMLYGGVFIFEKLSYQGQLDRYEIPGHCQNYTSASDDIPEDCEGKVEPVLQVGGFLKWGIAPFLGVILLYMAGLVVLGNRFGRVGIIGWIARLVGFLAISFFAILPFSRYFATAYGEILPWDRDKTPLWAYLDIHGIFLFILISMLLWKTARWLKEHRVADLRGLGVPVLVVAVLVPLLFLAGFVMGVLGEYRIFLVTIPLIGWLMILFLLPDQSNVERWVYMLMALALGLTMGVEMVVLQGDIGRQNMVFKFYIQTWLLLSITGGVALAWLVWSVWRWQPAVSALWQITLSILLTIGLMFPIMATQGRFEDRFNKAETPLTLDGMEYMLYAAYGTGPGRGVAFNLSGDYHLIRWMQDNVQGSPTIIEAQYIEYSWTSRVANYTGLPTVFGWRHHQSQQRNLEQLDQILWRRLFNVEAFYTTPDVSLAWELIEFYDIQYIVVGTFERIVYEDVRMPEVTSSDQRLMQNLAPGFDKFDVMVSMGLLERVYERDVCIHTNTRTPEGCPEDRLSTDLIYRVVPGATYDGVVAQRAE